MSAGQQPFLRRPPDQEVLGQLLHSISQPLTSLRCALELSMEEVAGQQQNAVSTALEQTDQVIGLVGLMREYLDTELSAPPLRPVPLATILRAVVEQLSSVAAVRQVRLQLTGTCTAAVPVVERRLQLALQYLIGAFIEAVPRNRVINLRLDDSPVDSLLRAEVESCSFPGEDPPSPQSKRDPVSATLRHMKLAIASRVLESAGASLDYDEGDQSSFALRVPRQPGAPLPPELFA
ncbi:MAG: hypothetical protein WAQ52_05815 [Terriglobales bacterium]